MNIAVASGKGGTGKTTVATSLALSLSAQGRKISVLDCDVEAPNAHLFLHPKFQLNREVFRHTPKVDVEKCTACGRCAEVCQYHAIVVIGSKTLVFPELCHSCGSCTLECPEKAITEIPEKLGILEAGYTPEGITFARGLLDVGEPMAVPVIRQLKKWQPPPPLTITIWDSPPGTSCPVVESIRGADFLLLVTEPTPFGLHDLKLAAQLATELDIPAGVVINRDGVGDTQVDAFCQQTEIPILMRIPLEREIGAGIAQGKTLIEIRPEYKALFQEMFVQIEANCAAEIPI
jgi:MinD superfamily P-loop ATPase